MSSGVTGLKSMAALPWAASRRARVVVAVAAGSAPAWAWARTGWCCTGPPAAETTTSGSRNRASRTRASTARSRCGACSSWHTCRKAASRRRCTSRWPRRARRPRSTAPSPRSTPSTAARPCAPTSPISSSATSRAPSRPSSTTRVRWAGATCSTSGARAARCTTARAASRTHEARSRSSSAGGGGGAALACRVCMDGPIDTLFLPCRHVLCCEQCAPRCNRCPLCRGEIEKFMHIFLPVEYQKSPGVIIK
ncbi:unnamed protein product [Leptidea sinapis]|uniref:RING-type domain-containing protein n=1 Tax=Leptidea sinapis TaxID=189913 RepID=A0A5E4QQV3_9NEOP|nr:unnamed protein product [Leptidea sinapis]